MVVKQTLLIFASILFIIIFLMAILRFSTWLKLRKNKKQSGAKKIIGFFHPFCDAGGGGEKVLFQAIHAL